MNRECVHIKRTMNATKELITCKYFFQKEDEEDYCKCSAYEDGLGMIAECEYFDMCEALEVILDGIKHCDNVFNCYAENCIDELCEFRFQCATCREMF